MAAPQKTSFLLVFLVWAAGLGAAAQYAKVSIVYDQLPDLYPNAGASLGFAVSFVGLVGVALGTVAGLLVSRLGVRPVLLWSLTFGALLSLWQATAPSFPLFLVSRILEGASHLALVVAAPTALAELTEARHRGFALSLWSTFFGVAFAILAWLGLPLVAAYGIDALFLAHGLYLAAFVPALALILPRMPRSRLGAPLPNPAEMVRDMVATYRSPRVGAPGIGWLFYTFCYVSILTLLPPFLAPESRAAILGAMPLIGIAVSLTLGVWLLRRISATHIIVAGFLIAAAAAGGLILNQGAPWLCFLLAGGLGLVQGASFAAVPIWNEPLADRARANGALAQMGNVGNATGTPLMAAAIGFAGYPALVWVATGTLILGALSHVLLARARG